MYESIIQHGDHKSTGELSASLALARDDLGDSQLCEKVV
ncbi:hypothetical protein [Escherichia phage IMM-001]|nr:hypothetical protein [Escherichia phage IMM-001]